MAKHAYCIRNTVRTRSSLNSRKLMEWLILVLRLKTKNKQKTDANYMQKLNLKH